MAENVGNKWSALLNGAIDSDDTSVAFDNAVGTLPSVNFRIVVQDAEDDDTNREIMLVTAGTATPLTVTRAQEGTTGVSHADNSYIVHVLTAEGLLALIEGNSVRQSQYADLTNSTTQTISTSNTTLLDLDTTVTEQPAGQHFTSNSALTGTVTKTASSTTLAGSSTLFLSELSVGQVISVPGTAAEKKVVVEIASNTSLTVASAYANTASGQTATRVRTAWVCPEAGRWFLLATVSWQTATSNWRGLRFYLNGAVWGDARNVVNMGTAQLHSQLGWMATLAQWDFIEILPETGTNSTVIGDQMFSAQYLDIGSNEGTVKTYLHDGSGYELEGSRVFIGPEDPEDDGFTLADGDVWEDTSKSIAVVEQGTSFPSSPATNDLFYRTDRGLMYFYDGTRWLTTTLYEHSFGSFNGITSVTGSDTYFSLNQDYDTWLVNFYASMEHTTSASGNYFTMTLYSKDGSTLSSALATVNGNGNTNNTLVRETAAVNAAVATGSEALLVIMAETGTATGFFNMAVTYRLVG